MIKREFWEKIAEVWAKKEEIEDGPDVPDEFIDLNEVEDWDALLKDILSPDSDEDIDLTDLLSD